MINKKFNKESHAVNDKPAKDLVISFLVFETMKDGKWYTLDEIHKATNDPHASISAQLRNLRKERFGSHVIEKRCKGNRSNGLWEYSMEI